MIKERPEFEVSSWGRVRSARRFVCRMSRSGAMHPMRVGGKILTPSLKKSGSRPVALRVTLSVSGVRLYRYVHRLVLEAFVGPAPEGTEGCHFDGNPLNNNLSNLRWDTHASNYLDSVRHGTNASPPTHKGEAHHLATLSDDEVAAIRGSGVAKGSYSALGRKYSVSHHTIRRIVLGHTRT